jgi:hypothetical protein
VKQGIRRSHGSLDGGVTDPPFRDDAESRELFDEEMSDISSLSREDIVSRIPTAVLGGVDWHAVAAHVRVRGVWCTVPCRRHHRVCVCVPLSARSPLPAILDRGLRCVRYVHASPLLLLPISREGL